MLGRTLVGSLGGTVQDIEDVYDLMLAREIEPAYTEITFDQIGEGLERLRRNEVTGRLVARFGDLPSLPWHNDRKLGIPS